MQTQISIFILAFYSVCSLTAMAGMNLSFGVVFLCFIFLAARARALVPQSVWALPEFKSYVRYGSCLFAACLLSLIIARFYPIIYAEHRPEITAHGFLKIWYLLCPLILLRVFAGGDAEEVDFRKIVRAWWGMVWGLAAVAVIQFYTGWPLKQVIPTNPNHYHAILFFGHHLSTSSILIFPTFSAFSVALGAWTRKREGNRVAWITAVLGFLILFLSYARTAWLATPIGILIVMARHLKPKVLTFCSFVLLILLGLGSQTPLLKDRIENSMGIQDRLRLWQANIDFFKHNPLTGIGWLKTQEMSEFYFKTLDPIHYHDYFWGHAHSNFFEMLGGTGAIGLIAFLAWSYFTLRLADRTAKLAEGAGRAYLSDFAWGIAVALILLHFNGLTNVTFWEGKVMHQQMWGVSLLLMIQFILNKGAKHGSQDQSRPQT